MQRFVERYKDFTWEDLLQRANCNMPPEEDRDWEAWNGLLAWSWFRCAWIVQEFFLSTKVQWLYSKEFMLG